MTEWFSYLPAILRAAERETRIRDLASRLLDLEPALKEAIAIIADGKVLANEIMPGLVPAENYSLEWVQSSLNSLGEHLVIDGDYGEMTKSAVKRFQAAHGLRVDGWAGPKTFICLVGVLSEKNKP